VTSWALSIAQAAAYVLLSPASVGLVRSIKARLQGRRGPDPLQPYRDLRKLLRKHPSVPTSASAVFLLVPPVVFTCFLLLGFALPFFYVGPRPGIDLLLVVALLGLAKFATALAAFDAGAPFGPMSGGRQLFIHVLAEPALLIVVYILALTNDTTNLAVIAAEGSASSSLAQPVVPLALGALGYVLLAESGRLPSTTPPPTWS
jgi:formate hydrogenlyase subunit 4